MKQFLLIRHSIILLTLIFTFTAEQAISQAPQIEWAKSFGGSGNDRATDVHRTADSGYVVTGFTFSNNGDVTVNQGGSDGWIVKLDVDGNLQWQKTFGGSADDALNAIRQLPDGSFIGCGYTSSTDGDIGSNHGGKDFWVIRTDSVGGIIWSKTFGGSSDDVANDMGSTADTGFVVVGYTFSSDGDVTNSKGGGDGWLLFIDTAGTFLNQKDKGGANYDEFKSIITAANGGFLLVGTSSSNNGTLDSLNHGGSDAWLARLSKFGTDQWNGLYGDTLDDGAFDVHETSGGDFVVSGYRNFAGQNDSWLFVVDSLGVFVSENTYGGIGDELAGSSIEKTQSNYIVAGSSNSIPSGDKNCLYAGYDIWMYNALNGGAITWQKCLGGTGDDISARAIASPDGSITVCGYSNSTDLDVLGNHGDNDFWVVRLLDGCDIEAAFTDSITDLTVSFTNNSFDGISFSWNFGDGDSSVEINPSHTYADTGVYTVCLIATSLCATDTFCSDVNVACNQVVSAFTFDANNTVIDFTSTGTFGSSWFWTFGDDSTSSEANPVHAYDTAGLYEVCLITSNFCSSDTFCSTIEVTCAPVVASFNYTVDSNTVTFTSTTPDVLAWKWKFGDSGNSTQENPIHAYADTGTYEACLVAFNECTSDTFCVDIHIGCVVAHAHYTFTQNVYSLSFTDQSTNTTSWNWTFGDGNSSSDQNPDHVYATVGDYEVCLTASNDCSDETLCDSVHVVCAAPAADFSYTTTNLEAIFADSSVNAASWSWSFGDGDTSNDQNPTHVYESVGAYLVCLVTSNVCGLDTVCIEITITCAPLNEGFDFVATNLSVAFNDLSSDGVSWDWTFGDGGSSNDQDPVHLYSAPGTYEACLIVSNGCDTATVCNEVIVVCPAFEVGFNIDQDANSVTFTDVSGTSVSWNWTFGDGGSSNAQNPTHTYAANGVYLVCLVASDGCSTDSTCDSVVVIGVGTQTLNLQESTFNIYPNPFSDVTTVSFNMPSASRVNITLNDLQGRMLSTLLNENLSAGTHSIQIPKKNLAAGVYLLQMKQGSESVVKRLIIE